MSIEREIVVLAPHTRGDTFNYNAELGNDWVVADFTGGLKFTLRRTIPLSSVVTDADAIDQATSGSGEIVGSGANISITIPASRTTAWPAGKKLVWDLQGVVAGATPRVYTIASGEITIRGDVTRST
jgi:hypothetical protein